MQLNNLDELTLLSRASSFSKNLREDELKAFFKEVENVIDKSEGNSHIAKLTQIRIESKNEDCIEQNLSEELESLFREDTLGCKVLMFYINKNINLIRKIANEFPQIDNSDFISPAYFSIKNSLLRYCPEEKENFAQVDTVINNALNYDLRNFAYEEKNLIKIPKYIGYQYSKVQKVVEDLNISLQRLPYPEEVLEQLENDPSTKSQFSIEKIKQLMILKDEMYPVSLNLVQKNDDGEEQRMFESIKDEDDEFSSYNDNGKYIFDKVKDRLSKDISEKNWDIFMKCIVLDYSSTKVGREYGVSRQAVNRIANEVWKKFRKVAKEYYGKN